MMSGAPGGYEKEGMMMIVVRRVMRS